MVGGKKEEKEPAWHRHRLRFATRVSSLIDRSHRLARHPVENYHYELNKCLGHENKIKDSNST